MAERRMFAKTIIDSDAFLDMPISARLLYYDLSMRADDDGFNNAPRKVMRMIGATTDDMNILITRKFVIPFESGVVVIKHWKIHNYIAKDRYKETKYKEEKATLYLDDNNAYTTCIQGVDKPETQVRLGKVRLGKVRKGEGEREEKPSPAEPPKEPAPALFGIYHNVKLTEKEYITLQEEFPLDYFEKIDRLSTYMETSGKSYSNHLAKIREWAMEDAQKQKKTDSRHSVGNQQTFRGEQRPDNDDDVLIGPFNNEKPKKTKKLPTDEEVEAFRVKMQTDYPDFTPEQHECFVESFKNGNWKK